MILDVPIVIVFVIIYQAMFQCLIHSGSLLCSFVMIGWLIYDTHSNSTIWKRVDTVTLWNDEIPNPYLNGNPYQHYWNTAAQITI